MLGEHLSGESTGSATASGCSAAASVSVPAGSCGEGGMRSRQHSSTKTRLQNGVKTEGSRTPGRWLSASVDEQVSVSRCIETSRAGKTEPSPLRPPAPAHCNGSELYACVLWTPIYPTTRSSAESTYSEQLISRLPSDCCLSVICRQQVRRTWANTYVAAEYIPDADRTHRCQQGAPQLDVHVDVSQLGDSRPLGQQL